MCIVTVFSTCYTCGSESATMVDILDATKSRAGRQNMGQLFTQWSAKPKPVFLRLHRARSHGEITVASLVSAGLAV